MGINEGLAYVREDWKKLLYVYWFFVPIIGWFALAGYMISVVDSLLKKEKSLPKLEFRKHLGEGFSYTMLQLVASVVVAIILYGLGLIPFIGPYLDSFLGFVASLLSPLLLIFYTQEKKLKNLLDYKKAFEIVMKKPAKYVVAYFTALIVTIIGMALGAVSLFTITLPLVFASVFMSLKIYVDYYKN